MDDTLYQKCQTCKGVGKFFNDARTQFVACEFCRGEGFIKVPPTMPTDPTPTPPTDAERLREIADKHWKADPDARVADLALAWKVADRLEALEQAARRYYHADGSFETLASAGEVIERRKAAARRLAALEDRNAALVQSADKLATFGWRCMGLPRCEACGRELDAGHADDCNLEAALHEYAALDDPAPPSSPSIPATARADEMSERVQYATDHRAAEIARASEEDTP